MKVRFPLVALVALVAVGLVLAACGATASPSLPAASPSPVGTPSPSPAGSPAPSAAPSTDPSAPANSPTPTAETPSPSPSTPPAFSAAERRLLDALRADARIGCAPRRTDLPPHAIAGIECRVDSTLVDRVGVYGFEGSVDAGGHEVGTALGAYLDRLAAAGVKPRSGDCAAGTAGDRSWPAALPDTGEGGAASLRAERSGCFLDGDGSANIRLTCYGDIYIGVLGRSADIAALHAWSWKVADGDSTDRDPPGLCAAPD